MASIIPNFEYDIFISYRHNDNRSSWVTEFVEALQEELAATIKEPISIYFDKNPHDGLQSHHEVDDSLREKLKSLILIPIVSQTYCDPKAFAWAHELIPFIQQASEDNLGLKTRVSGGNIASRVLPIKIHDIDNDDRQLFENATGSVMRSLDFIYKESGVNRPLRPADDRDRNQEQIDYRNQVNKVANAIKEILYSLKQSESLESEIGTSSEVTIATETRKGQKKVKQNRTNALQRKLTRFIRFSQYQKQGIFMGVGLSLILTFSGYWLMRDKKAYQNTPPPLRYEISMKANLGRAGRNAMKISPDGKYVVYVMNEELMIKSMSTNGDAVVIPGTKGARQPFFSPDGRWIGFEDHARDMIMKVPLAGGNPIKICDIPNHGGTFGINWIANKVYFSDGFAIFQVPEDGGTPEQLYPLNQIKSTLTVWNPQLLPDNETFLFTQRSLTIDQWDLVIWPLGSKDAPKVLLENAIDGKWLGNGGIAYILDDRLYVVEFEPTSRTITTTPKLIVTKPIRNFRSLTSAAQFDFSNNGIIVYSEDKDMSRHLVWFDQADQKTIITNQADFYGSPTISPNGQTIAVDVATDDNQTFFDVNLINPTSGASSPFVKNAIFPVWSKDGKSLYYSSGNKLLEKPVDLTYEPKTLVELDSGLSAHLGNLSGDGRYLVMSINDNIAYFDFKDNTLNYLDFINTTAVEFFPSLSPNGKWLAYSSNRELYVAPFPGPGQPQKVSTGEGFASVWSHDMQTLYYNTSTQLDNQLYKVKINTTGSFSAGNPVPIISSISGSYYRYLGNPSYGKFDVDQNGNRFLGVMGPHQLDEDHFNVIVNWEKEVFKSDN